ncbi:MAG: site-specific integrase [FCB group bacterium]|nr:site-specific integrase [FCB group bacterium]
MSYHKLNDGRWYVQYTDPSKKSGRARRYCGRGPAGEKKAVTENDRLNPGPYRKKQARAAGPTFAEIADAYFKAKIGTIENSSYNCLYYKLTGVILPLVGHVPAQRLTPSRMDQYVAKRLKAARTVTTGAKTGKQKKKPLLDDTGKPKTIKRSTVHREISDIVAILNWSVSRQYIKVNPLAGYKKPKRDDEIISPPTLSETRAIMSHAAEHLKRAISLSYYTGLRPGAVELLSLKWTDVDFDSCAIVIRSAKKNGLRSRTVPLKPAFIKTLKKWKAWDRDNLYIIRYHGKPISSIKKAFAAAKHRAGITRRIRPYDLRHAFATGLLSAGSDLKSTSEMLGHSRPDTTVRIYQHTNLAQHRRTIENLPDL